MTSRKPRHFGAIFARNFLKIHTFSWNIDIFRNYRVIKRIWNECSYHSIFMKLVVCFTVYPRALWLGDIKHTTCFINTVWNENSFQILYILHFGIYCKSLLTCKDFFFGAWRICRDLPNARALVSASKANAHGIRCSWNTLVEIKCLSHIFGWNKMFVSHVECKLYPSLCFKLLWIRIDCCLIVRWWTNFSKVSIINLYREI